MVYKRHSPKSVVEERHEIEEHTQYLTNYVFSLHHPIILGCINDMLLMNNAHSRQVSRINMINKFRTIVTFEKLRSVVKVIVNIMNKTNQGRANLRYIMK